MYIYSSTKVLSYVYEGIHKVTGQVYIGSRVANKVPAHLDLPIYKTSSKYVRPIFEEFYWIIVAEFFNPDDAYDHEQFLIHEQWQISKEQSLNEVCFHGKKAWNTIGRPSPKRGIKTGPNLKSRGLQSHRKGLTLTEEHKQNISIANKGQIISEETKLKMSKIKTKLYDFITPEGLIIEQISIKTLTLDFNLDFNGASVYFSKNNNYKGFTRLTSFPSS